MSCLQKKKQKLRSAWINELIFSFFFLFIEDFLVTDILIVHEHNLNTFLTERQPFPPGNCNLVITRINAYSSKGCNNVTELKSRQGRMLCIVVKRELEYMTAFSADNGSPLIWLCVCNMFRADSVSLVTEHVKYWMSQRKLGFQTLTLFCVWLVFLNRAVSSVSGFLHILAHRLVNDEKCRVCFSAHLHRSAVTQINVHMWDCLQ